ncbi:hypothetical protein [Saccharopolyspora phatthalungensis]|uniref:Uncharacterized protein n=1 Tax=Saccharopolyspora phatthalungensis TaxID=664693 RepID=A0A840QDI1_9PSEU|nr:hypothetical protein [Saccharopolyspora phatthalungensis]MBB5156619.1 hypothetical protein [Saccharopolyspora phatthalungensis]
MSAETAAVAILLRRIQWLFNDFAFRAEMGQLDAVDIDMASAALEENILLLLREKGSTAPAPMDQPDRTA